MHLAVAISAHGLGHGAQTTAVLSALRAQLPDLALTLFTGLPRDFLRARIPGDFTLIDWRADFGMRMHSALDIDCEASAADYVALHADWPARVGEAAARLEGVAPDLLLANVPYLPLAAAARIGLPSIALCSLNWADIYRQYLGDRAEAPAILEQMESAYNSALRFLCPAPSMPMASLDNRHPIGPLARIGTSRRAELCARLGIADGRRLVLISPGGIPLRLPLEDWPVAADIVWIVPQAWAVRRADIHPFEELGLSFVDVLASCDALLGKLGYGIVAECGCNGTPMLYIPRQDWPEEPYLADWLGLHGRCLPVARRDVELGRLRDALERLWSMPAPAPAEPTGAVEAASEIRACLGERVARSG